MVFGIFDKIPHNKEIINIAHIFYGVQLVGETFPQFVGGIAVARFQTFFAKFLKKFPG